MSIEDIIRRVDKRKAERANWETYWQDLAHFCLPRRAFITRTRVSGEKLDFHRIYDANAIRSLRTMAAGFHSHLTNPSSKWFSLATQNRKLMERRAVRLWFKDVEDEMFSTINTTNFDPVLQEFYLTSGCFGTGVVLEEEDIKTRIRFTAIPIEEILIEEDARGRIVRVYRMFEYTVQQAFDRWGDLSGKAVADNMRSNNFMKKLTFIHAVFPREDREAGKKDNQNMPWASIWLEKSQKHKISESGFNEMPYAVGRFFKETNEVFGFSPAMTALPDIKMLNAEKRSIIRAAQKVVDPPLNVPSRGYMLPLNMNPSAVNYRNPQLKADSLQPIITKGNLPIGFEMLRDVKSDIEEAFFVPLFRAFAQITKQMTVPEVQRRIGENMVLLGPVVGRFTQEVLDPLIIRAFNILARLGAFPPPPQEIQGEDFDIVYISQLAKAQRLGEIASIERTLFTIGEIAKLKPDVLDVIDEDKTALIVGDVNGANPEIFRDEKEVAGIREDRAIAQEQAQKMAILKEGADTAKVVSEADKNLKGR